MWRLQTTFWGLTGLLIAAGSSCLAESALPAAQSEPGAAATIPSAAAVHEDVIRLHPAFRFSADQCRAWLAAGQKLASDGRKFDKLAKNYEKTPNWVRGKHGKSSARVWCYTFDGGFIQSEAFRAQTLYEEPRLPTFPTTSGGYCKQLIFSVVLVSQPKIGQDPTAAFLSGLASGLDPGNSAQYYVPPQVLREANASEVRAIKFVLSDDQGHNFTAEDGSTAAQDSSGSMTFTGVLPKPSAGSVSTTAGGLYARSTYTCTEFVPYAQEHPYFRASYNVVFGVNPKVRTGGTSQ